MYNYDLIRYAEKNPDLFNKDEALEYIKEEEITIRDYENKAVEYVNDAIDCLTESVQEKSSDYIDRWFDSGDFCNYDIPEGMNSREFAFLVMDEVKKKLGKINT